MRALLALPPPTVVPSLVEVHAAHPNTAGTLLASSPDAAHDVAADLSRLVVHTYAAHDDAGVGVR
jgi:hypothetical protein